MKKVLFAILSGLLTVSGLSAQTSPSKEGSAGTIEIKDATHFNETVKSGDLVLVDFYATWCGPCKMMPPILKQLKEEIKKPLVIAKVDVDKNGGLSRMYGISAIPTLLLFKNGKLVWSNTGVTSLEELKKVVNKY